MNTRSIIQDFVIATQLCTSAAFALSITAHLLSDTEGWSFMVIPSLIAACVFMLLPHIWLTSDKRVTS